MMAEHKNWEVTEKVRRTLTRVAECNPQGQQQDDILAYRF